MRTINDCLDPFTNALHFGAYVPHFTINCFYIDVDAVSDPQNLCKRHSGLLLRQVIQSLERILQIRPSCQFLQDLFYTQFSRES